jgi:hypothetical protein
MWLVLVPTELTHASPVTVRTVGPTNVLVVGICGASAPLMNVSFIMLYRVMSHMRAERCAIEKNLRTRAVLYNM